MRSGKRKILERIEIPNKKKIIRTLREKETYNYLGTLEADTIKQAEIREKNLKRVSQESECGTIMCIHIYIYIYIYNKVIQVGEICWETKRTRFGSAQPSSGLWGVILVMLS